MKRFLQKQEIDIFVQDCDKNLRFIMLISMKDVTVDRGLSKINIHISIKNKCSH